MSPSQDSTDTELEQTVLTRTKTVHHSLALETGTTYWDFLFTQFQRGGLFLWADSFGGFVLSQPNGKQAPIYRLVYRRDGKGGESGDVNVVGRPTFRRSAIPRYSEYHVMGRRGSGASGSGRGQAFSRQIDQEVVALLNPNPADRADGGKIKKVKTFKDNKVKTPAQAAFLALRKMADARRKSLTLKYPIAGHTLPALTGGGRLVVQHDTVVHLIDEDLGIDGPMYIADVQYSRLPKSSAVLELMRCEDLLFGEEDLLTPPRTVSKKGAVRIGRTEVFRPQWVKDPNWGNLPTLRTVHLNADGSGFDVDKGVKRVR